MDVTFSPSELLAMIGLSAGGVAWLLALERRLGRKIDRSELEGAVRKLEQNIDARHAENSTRMQRQDDMLSRLLQTVVEHSRKAREYRHETRNELQTLVSNQELILQRLGSSPRGRGLPPTDGNGEG